MFQYGISGSFKPFTKVRVNYGKPIYYNKDEIDLKNKEQVQGLTEQLMKTIVELIK